MRADLEGLRKLYIKSLSHAEPLETIMQDYSPEVEAMKKQYLPPPGSKIDLILKQHEEMVATLKQRYARRKTSAAAAPSRNHHSLSHSSNWGAAAPGVQPAAQRSEHATTGAPPGTRKHYAGAAPAVQPAVRLPPVSTASSTAVRSARPSADSGSTSRRGSSSGAAAAAAKPQTTDRAEKGHSNGKLPPIHTHSQAAAAPKPVAPKDQQRHSENGDKFSSVVGNLRRGNLQTPESTMLDHLDSIADIRRDLYSASPPAVHRVRSPAHRSSYISSKLDIRRLIAVNKQKLSAISDVATSGGPKALNDLVDVFPER